MKLVDCLELTILFRLQIESSDEEEQRKLTEAEESAKLQYAQQKKRKKNRKLKNRNIVSIYVSVLYRFV